MDTIANDFMKDKSEIKIEPKDSKATFYCVLYPSFRKAAIECGYSLAIHGSMARDMDLIAVAWTEDAKPIEDLVKAINDAIGGTVWEQHNLTSRKEMPHGRICYTLSIMGDWFIDLSIIPPKKPYDPTFGAKEPESPYQI